MQDTELFKNEGPNNAFYEVLLRSCYGKLRGGLFATELLDGKGIMWLVSSCMNRFAQARVAVLLNCFVAAV